MKSKKVLTIAIFTFGVFAGGTVHAEIFVRPSLWHVDYRADGFDAKMAGAIEGGVAFGASGQHALGVEFARVSWERDLPLLAATPASMFGQSGAGHVAPVLASYRYYFQTPSARWRVFAGASVGTTKITGRIETRLSGIAYGGEVKGWAATWNATAGIAANLGRNVSLELSYRHLAIDDIDYRTNMFVGAGGFTGPAGPTQSFAATKARVAALGVSWKF